LRGYVKPIDDKTYYRFELLLSPNQPIKMALERMIQEVKIDGSTLFLERAENVH